jgi:2'-5' RNA ligase
MPRLFAGIELPDDACDELMRLEAPLNGARWQEHEELHLTLRFAGDVGNRQARDLADALATITVDVFTIKIKGLGAFGGNEPRSIWAGIEPNEQLEQLARACERAARQAGLPPETRKFKPHITLARLRGARVEAIAAWLQTHGGLSLPPLTIERFVLFSSKPNVGGGPYVIEDVFPLRGSRSGDFDDEYRRW